MQEPLLFLHSPLHSIYHHLAKDTMLLFKSGFLPRLASLFLAFALFTNSTPFSPIARGNAFEDISSIGLQDSGHQNVHNRWYPTHKPSPSESDRSHSLMPLGRRDLSEWKQIAHAIWYDYLPIISSSVSQAALVMKQIFSDIYNQVTNNPQQALSHYLRFTYGAFEFTLRSSTVMVWDTVLAVVDWVNERMIGGMVGFFLANIITIAGVTIVASHTLIIAAIFWLARFPALGPNDPPDPLDWMKYGR